jgi:hypothetical protein
MVNIFSEFEDSIFFDESMIFDENKIRGKLTDVIIQKLNSCKETEKGFVFEEIICDALEFLSIPFIKTKKTRDFGLDGIIRIKLDIFGEANIGLQIKYKLIDSNDLDLFLSALRNAEIQLGVIICKDSRELQKYELNSKIKAILLSKGVKIKEKLIKENITINPVFILKFDDILDMTSTRMRDVVRAIYKQ